MKIAYDCKLDRPGCVMVAAGLGTNTKIVALFEPSSWLVHLTDDMGIYEITESQLCKLAERVNDRYQNKQAGKGG